MKAKLYLPFLLAIYLKKERGLSTKYIITFVLFNGKQMNSGQQMAKYFYDC